MGSRTFAVVLVTNTLHSNQVTTNDYRREAGFQAANAGYDGALSCLTKFNPQSSTMDWPSPTAISAPIAPGGLTRPSETTSVKTAMRSAPFA